MPKILLGLGLMLLLFSIALLSIPLLQPWDQTLIAAFASYRSPELTFLAQALAWLGGMPAVLAMGLIACLLLYRLQNFAAIGFVSGAIVGSIALSWLLKYLIDRPRPDAIWAIFNSYGDSFPSGHSAYAATLAALMVLTFQAHAKRHIFFACAGLWLLLMGLSRIYLGVHYLSDVLAGWAIGLLWVSLLWQLLSMKYPLNLFGHAHKLDKN